MVSRQAKKEDARARIGAALIAAIQETGAMPDVENVARRAGLGRRTVFRYFDGRAELEIEMARALRVWATSQVPLPAPSGGRAARLNALIAHRARLYELVTPVRRYLDGARARGNAAIDDFIGESREMLRGHLVAMLSPELRDRPLFADALEIATSWEAWRALREGQRCDVREAKARVLWLVEAILVAPAIQGCARLAPVDQAI